MDAFFQSVVSFFNSVVSIIKKVADIEAIGKWASSLLPNIATALIIFGVGWWISGVIAKFVLKGMERGNVDEGIRSFLYSCLKTVIKVIAGIMALAALGLNVTTLVAALGTVGVALSLALQDSLSNFASGVLILFNSMFHVGDFIEVDGKTGTVKRIELMNTTLATADNKRIIIPNSIMTSSMIINYTAKDIRRLDLSVGVAYSSDIATVKNAIMSALTGNEHVHPEKEPVIGIASFDDSAITFDIKVWVDTESYNKSKYLINESILEALTQAGIEIPFNQLDVHMISDNHQGA